MGEFHFLQFLPAGSPEADSEQPEIQPAVEREWECGKARQRWGSNGMGDNLQNALGSEVVGQDGLMVMVQGVD